MAIDLSPDEGGGGGALQTLQTDQLTFLGGFRVPLGFAADEGDSEVARGLTHRYVGGQLRMFSAYWQDGEIHEFTVPTPSLTEPYPQANQIRNWGLTPYGGLKPYPTIGLFWDETDQRLYWIYQSDYTTVGDDKSLGYAILNDTDGTAEVHGLFGFPSAPSYKSIKGITPVPTEYQAQLGGKRLAVGFGGCESNVAAGPASVGPMLAPFDPAQLVEGGNIPASAVQVLMEHPYQSTRYADPQRAKRNDKYHGLGYLSWPPQGGVSYWTAVDQVAQAGVWIRTEQTQGFLVFANQVAANDTANYSSFVQDGLDVTFQIDAPMTNVALNDIVAVPDSTGGPYPAVNSRVTAFSDTELSVTLVVDGGPITNPVPEPTGTLFRGVNYFNAQVWVTRSQPVAYVYDSDVLLSGLETDKVPWNEEAVWSFPVPAWHYKNRAIADLGTPMGVTFDSTTKRLYVLMQKAASTGQDDRSVVFVYQLNEP